MQAGCVGCGSLEQHAVEAQALMKAQAGQAGRHASWVIGGGRSRER
jgi:hypothetical protein